MLGPAGVRVFTRASGKKLSDGVPGFFTVDGFHKVLLPALPAATREVASESWVMGQKVPGSLDNAQQTELANSVVKLYLDDYAKAWDGLLQDLEIVPLRSLPQAAQDLYVLASPQSPLKDLLTAIARQVTLSEPPKPSTAEAAAEAAAKKAAAAAAPAATRGAAALSSILSAASRCRARAAARPRDRRTLQATARPGRRRRRRTDRPGAETPQRPAAAAGEDERRRRRCARRTGRQRSFARAQGRVPAAAAAAWPLAGRHGRIEHGVARRRRPPAGDCGL